MRQAPPFASTGISERTKLARWALWDIVEGARLWRMWLRLSANEVRRRYKRTLLGPMWVTVSMLVFAVILAFVWAGLWNMQVKQFLPFLLSGLIPWGMISGSVGEGCTVLLGGEGMIKSRQFPYSTLIYSVLARNTILLGHNLLGYLVVAALCGVALNWRTALIVPGIALAIINAAWMCFLVAILCLRYRDFTQIVGSLLQIAVFVTPVFYMAEQLKGNRAMIVHLNPLHYLLDIVRQPMLGKSAAPLSYLVCVAMAVLGWTLAYSLLARKRHRLAYWY